jgi:hypothetical protein
MNRFEKLHAGIHPKVLAQMKPSERPKAEAPKLQKEASLGAMRKALIEKKPESKEVKKYLEEVVTRMSREEHDDADD